MENASKALIIAGAILISILLISIGIIVINAINDPIDQATDSATSQAIEMFNSKFTGYAGPNQKASAVKALITAVNSSNGANKEHQIGFDGISSFGLINSQKTYTVELSDENDPKDGYYDTVTITEN